jgi:uncharacterized membrane protein
MVSKLRHPTIDTSMIEAAKGDMTPGTSVLVLLSSEAAIDTVAETLQGLGMELTRSDLSVQQQDHVMGRVQRSGLRPARQAHSAVIADAAPGSSPPRVMCVDRPVLDPWVR